VYRRQFGREKLCKILEMGREMKRSHWYLKVEDSKGRKVNY
jgi:hypothetical protein